MRIASSTFPDPCLWVACAAAGVAPMVPQGGGEAAVDSGWEPLVPILSLGAMLFGSFLLGVARRRVVELLSAWSTRGESGPPSGSTASASQAAD